MNIKNILTELGSILFGICFLIAIGIISGIFIYGATWVSAKLLPWFTDLSLFVFIIVIFILLPLAISKSTRELSSIGLFIASYVFGITLWMKSLLLTIKIWGVSAVVIGLIFLGVGIVPIAMLATLIKGMWNHFFELIFLIIITYACRFGSLYLAGSLEDGG